MQLAKAVANAAAALVLKAKNVAQKTEDSAQQNRVIAAATQCALSTSQLVACTRVSTGTCAGWSERSQLILLRALMFLLKWTPVRQSIMTKEMYSERSFFTFNTWKWLRLVYLLQKYS